MSGDGISKKQIQLMMAALEEGIVPFFDNSQDFKNAMSSLSKTERTKARRKFRKIWRKKWKESPFKNTSSLLHKPGEKPKSESIFLRRKRAVKHYLMKMSSSTIAKK